ncbi:hypothetical protein FSP39_021609 [Pinctada imbricata]|uniref:Uncharacterized protein n=1 Tax=Pinctada imbricata TaxID=66713 RepID=A0AA88YF19_PINIB|nr:hypothetical protein FSP39_021609 [Pinctada imbricata]
MLDRLFRKAEKQIRQSKMLHNFVRTDITPAMSTSSNSELSGYDIEHKTNDDFHISSECLLPTSRELDLEIQESGNNFEAVSTETIEVQMNDVTTCTSAQSNTSFSSTNKDNGMANFLAKGFLKWARCTVTLNDKDINAIVPNSFIANLDEAACRQAMFNHVAEQCCYGSKPAEEMTINSFKSLTAFHYTLETFCEGRKTGFKSVPYRGGPVDGPHNGPPPPPWMIDCVADSMFHTHEKYLEVPHTATVRPCHNCDARGYFRCWECGGWGRIVCDDCDGRGHHDSHDPYGNPIRQNCHRCHGDGIASCDRCGGDGRITCEQCDGYKSIKTYIELTVTFTNHVGEHIVERTDMPDELIREGQGDTLFEQTLPFVHPITSYPVPDINNNSIRLVNQHKGAFPSERQLQQRQILRAVPVTEVHYSWQEYNTRYWIYGQQRAVYAPDYPHQCCWGYPCSIM